MLCTGIVTFIILMIIEYRVLESAMYVLLSLRQQKFPAESEDGVIDADVLEEKQRVAAMSPMEIESNNLVMQKVSKYYGKFLAVNQISIAIKP